MSQNDICLFFQQYHIVDSCSLPASLWSLDWFVEQPSPSHQLVLLLGTRVFLSECRPPHPSFWVSPCWFQIRFILFYHQDCFEFQFCLWKCCSGLSRLILLKILLKPRYTTSTADPCPPALWPCQRRKFGWFDIIHSSQIHVGCFPSPCYPLRVPDWLSNHLAEYFSGCQTSVDCSITPLVVFLFLSKGRYHALPSVSESHVSKFIHTWLIGSTLPGIARSAGSTQWVHGQSCR